MTPDWLRSLLAAATPGPWKPAIWHFPAPERMRHAVNAPYADGRPGNTNAVAEMCAYMPEMEERAKDNAALIALAPEISEWATSAYALLSDPSWNHMSVSRAALVGRYEEIGSAVTAGTDPKAAA